MKNAVLKDGECSISESKDSKWSENKWFLTAACGGLMAFFISRQLASGGRRAAPRQANDLPFSPLARRGIGIARDAGAAREGRVEFGGFSPNRRGGF